MESVVNRKRAASWIHRYRSVLLLLGALLIGGMAAVGTRNYIADQLALERAKLQPDREEIDVIVAKRDMQRGEFVGPDTMAVRRIPAEYASAAVVQPDRFDAFVGARLNMPLRAGEPLIAPGVDGQDASTFSTKVRSGIRALTIAVDEVNSISGMLQPSDRIDLQLTARPIARGALGGSLNEVTKVLMQDLLVLATGRQVRQLAEDGTRGRTFTAITVEVSPEQAQKLIVAQRGGRLTAILRNRDDRMVVEQKAIDINDLLGLPPEGAPRRGPPQTELIVGGQGPLRSAQLNAHGMGLGALGENAAAASALLQQLGAAAGSMKAGLANGPTPSTRSPAKSERSSKSAAIAASADSRSTGQ